GNQPGKGELSSCAPAGVHDCDRYLDTPCPPPPLPSGCLFLEEGEAAGASFPYPGSGIALTPSKPLLAGTWPRSIPVGGREPSRARWGKGSHLGSAGKEGRAP